jgi:roadblock/LC7 domain-containing protein
MKTQITFCFLSLLFSGLTFSQKIVLTKNGERVPLNATAVGLGNVDNTSDANKPVSTAQQTALNLKANIAAPTFTGDAKAVTPTAGDNDTSIATTAFVTAADNLKADIASPTFTGDAKAVTPTAGDNDTSIATTAFVTAADNLKANLTSNTFTGNQTINNNSWMNFNGGTLYMDSQVNTGDYTPIIFRDNADRETGKFIVNENAIVWGNPETTTTYQMGCGGWGMQNVWQTQIGAPPTFYVFGNLSAASITNRSDRRLKRNIEPLASGLIDVMKLKPSSYEKKAEMETHEIWKPELGFIAQEVAEVLPNLVQESATPEKWLTLNYIELIPVLTKAIQEQEAKIQSQQKDIEELKKLVAQLLQK